jgi:hypothetical protein
MICSITRFRWIQVSKKPKVHKEEEQEWCIRNTVDILMLSGKWFCLVVQ